LFVAAAGAGLLWFIARGSPTRSGAPDLDEFDGYSPPLAEMPEPDQEVVSNNETAKLKMPPALDGTAVMYPMEVRGLIAPDGHFQTDLSAVKMATLLNLDARAIAKTGSISETDPDAVLFAAVIGRLSGPGKARLRWEREQEGIENQPSSTAGDEWVKTVYPFTLKALKSPTYEQKQILDAISRSARKLRRQAGEKFNAHAVRVTRDDLMSGAVRFTAGLLPLESAGAQ
jgi:hypothetical protein